MSNIDQIKQLREETDVSFMQCKKAIEEAGGNIETAKEILRKWGSQLAQKKSEREVSQGVIGTYIHPNGKIGVMVELLCESDFVAKSDDFKELAHDICLQIAATKPLYLKAEGIPAEILEKEKAIYQEQMKDEDKPKEILEQIIAGKISKYEKGISLLSQGWIKDESKTIQGLVEEYVTKLKENIVVEKFTRYEI